MNAIQVKDQNDDFTTIAISKIIRILKISKDQRDNRPRWAIKVADETILAFEDTWEIADEKYECLRSMMEYGTSNNVTPRGR